MRNFGRTAAILAALWISGQVPAIAEIVQPAPRVDFTGHVMLLNDWKKNIALGAIDDFNRPRGTPELVDVNALPSVSGTSGDEVSGPGAGRARLAARYERAAAAWSIEPSGDSNRFRFRSGRLPGRCLSVDAQNNLALSGCDITLGTENPALWAFEADPSVPGLYRIRRDGTNDYLNIETGNLAVSPVEPGWWSARWRILSSNVVSVGVPGLWDNYKP